MATYTTQAEIDALAPTSFPLVGSWTPPAIIGSTDFGTFDDTGTTHVIEEASRSTIRLYSEETPQSSDTQVFYESLPDKNLFNEHDKIMSKDPPDVDTYVVWELTQFAGDLEWLQQNTGDPPAAVESQTTTQGVLVITDATGTNNVSSQYGVVNVKNLVGPTTLNFQHTVDQESWALYVSKPNNNAFTLQGNGVNIPLVDSNDNAFDNTLNNLTVQKILFNRKGTNEYEVSNIKTITPRVNVMSFDGSSSYLDLSAIIPDDITTIGTGLTFSAWINQTAAVTQMLFAHRDKVAAYLQVFARSTSTLVSRAANDAGTVGNEISGPFNINTWTHVAATFDFNGNITHYINGVAVASEPYPTGATTSTLTLIGAQNNGSGLVSFFEGSMFDAQLYASSLTAANITTLSATEGAVIGTPFARYLDSEEDVSGNNNNAVNNNVDSVRIDSWL